MTVVLPWRMTGRWVLVARDAEPTGAVRQGRAADDEPNRAPSLAGLPWRPCWLDLSVLNAGKRQPAGHHCESRLMPRSSVEGRCGHLTRALRTTPTQSIVWTVLLAGAAGRAPVLTLAQWQPEMPALPLLEAALRAGPLVRTGIRGYRPPIGPVVCSRFLDRGAAKGTDRRLQARGIHPGWWQYMPADPADRAQEAASAIAGVQGA